MPATKTRRVHHRRLSPAPAFHTASALPEHTKAVGHTPNPPTLGGPCDRGTREQGGGHPTGPRTPEGKAIASRNATTHGLFCRQTVLPHLGEDPQGYKELLQALEHHFSPRSLMEKQYLELWADASWKMRRLSRFEAQVWENDALSEDERLHKLERVLRLQASVRRQMDKAVHMLGGRDVPSLLAHYARRAILADRGLTEEDCKHSPELAARVEEAVRADVLYGDSLGAIRQENLDNARPAEPETKKCQNEPHAPQRAERTADRHRFPDLNWPQGAAMTSLSLSDSPRIGGGGASDAAGNTPPA